MKRKRYVNAVSVVAVLLFLILVGSCIHDPFLNPIDLNDGEPTTPGCISDGNVCFESSVLPIFISSCAKSGCHNASSKEEGFVLDNYNNIVRKGISPGNASNSKLYKVLFAGGEDQMPPGAPLTQAQKDSIKLWINQGAKNTVNCNCFCDTSKFTFAAIIQPMLATNCVGCHKPSSLGGNIDLSTYATVKTQVNNGKLVGSITHAIGYKAMPQGGKLRDCEITQIKNWIDAGAINN